MITISKRVEQLIHQWSFLNQALDLELINVSALARYLQPQLEAEIGETISEAAVLMALRRYQQKKKQSAAPSSPKDFIGDITIRSNLTDLTFTNSVSLPGAIAAVSANLPSNNYLTASRGVLQTSVIVHTRGVERVKRLLASEHLETEVAELTAITLQLKQGHTVAGVLVYPLQLLAWQGIAVVEVVSTYDELNIILHDEDIEQAFSLLKNAIS